MVLALCERHAAGLLPECDYQWSNVVQLRQGQLLVSASAPLCVQRQDVASARLALSEDRRRVPLSRRNRNFSESDELELLPRPNSEHIPRAKYGPQRRRTCLVPAGSAR